MKNSEDKNIEIEMSYLNALQFTDQFYDQIINTKKLEFLTKWEKDHSTSDTILKKEVDELNSIKKTLREALLSSERHQFKINCKLEITH